MTIKLSVPENIKAIMKIVGDAQRYLASQNIDQWQDGYPSEELIALDIENQNSYIITNDTGNITATLMFTTQPESSYYGIDGKWITAHNATYGVIHRLAVDENYRGTGISRFVFQHFENWLKAHQIESLRLDTHLENQGMQNLLKSLNYTYCGVIILESGDKRLAFEKLV